MKKIVIAVAVALLSVSGAAFAMPGFGHMPHIPSTSSSLNMGGSGFSNSFSNSNSAGQSFIGVSPIAGGGFQASLGSEQASGSDGGTSSGAGFNTSTTGNGATTGLGGNLNTSGANSTTKGATSAIIGGGADVGFAGFGGGMSSEDSSTSSNTEGSIAGAGSVTAPTMPSMW